MKRFFLLFVLIAAISTSLHSNSVERPPFFSIDQEIFFAEHPESLAYFTELYVQKKSPEQIGREHNLSVEENIQHLKDLVRMSIIKISSDQASNVVQLSSPYTFLVSGTQHFREDGPLTKKFNERTFQEYFKKIETDIKEKNLTFYNSGFWITEAEHQKFIQELDALEKKYFQMSLQNRKNKTTGAHRVSAFTVMIPNWEPAFYTEVKKKQ